MRLLRLVLVLPAVPAALLVQHGRREVVPVGEQQRSWLTDDELNAIEVRANAATPGPWRACTWDPMERPHVTVVAPDEAICHGRLDLPRTPEDARFIAHARTDVPRLTAEVRALWERLDLALQVCRAVAEQGGVSMSERHTYTCLYCRPWKQYTYKREAEHEPDCPVLLARRLLEELPGVEDEAHG